MKCVCVQHHGGGQLLTQEKEWIGGNDSKKIGLKILDFAFKVYLVNYLVAKKVCFELLILKKNSSNDFGYSYLICLRFFHFDEF